MAYTRRGPFTNASPTGPYVDAGFFNAVEDSLVAATPSTGSGSTVAAGGTFTITVPSFSGGILMIYATAGGGWSSVWAGVYAADSGRVDVTQLGTDFTTPGQLIVSVVGSTTSTAVTVTTAASGSTGIFNYTLLRSGGS